MSGTVVPSPIDFRPGHTMHWIQARLAWEDFENWRAGLLTSIKGRKLSVQLADDIKGMYWSISAPRFVDDLPLRVFVNERYSVLAMESSEGNVISREVEPPFGSVFALSGARRFLFISIAKFDDPRRRSER